MITKPDKNKARLQRAKRQSGIHGTAKKPRLVVNRSLNEMYAQLIDDDKGITLATANTLQEAVVKLCKGKTKREAAFIVGEQIAKAASAKKIKEVVFDRGGFIYHGRVQELAEGARAGGLKF